MLERSRGPLLILLAALLWGTDSLFRFPSVDTMDPTYIVFVEHVAGIVVLSPWLLKYGAGGSGALGGLFALGWLEWVCAVIVGACGGAIATVLFTASFRYVNPSVAVLLQKLQPIFTVLLAFVLLGERPARKFYPWAVVALAAGFVLSFPDLNLGFLREPGNLHARGLAYALGASVLWGITTVVGRRLLLKATPTAATFWRYFFGTCMLGIILAAAGIPVTAEPLLHTRTLIALAYLSFVTGIIPMLAYYGGLARTPASVTTFIELMYPVSAVVLNTLILHTPLSHVQMGAGAALLFAVTMISLGDSAS
jgi:drug/metabolite transporter (DMT)-like permease